MHMTIDRVVARDTVFAWIALLTGLLLLIPLIAMRFTTAVDWGILDFLVMGALMFGTGSLFVLVARRVPWKYWPLAAVLSAAAFVYVWAELAVGIFTSLGS